MLWCTKWEVRGGVLELCRHSSACGQWSASGTTAFPSRARAIPTESTGTGAGAGAAGPRNELCWAMGAVWWWVSRRINVLCSGSLLQENRCAVVPPVRSWQPSCCSGAAAAHADSCSDCRLASDFSSRRSWPSSTRPACVVAHIWRPELLYPTRLSASKATWSR